MSCIDCNGTCQQGRYCPHRKTWDNNYHARYLILIESIRTWIQKTFKKHQ